jgi:PADRE domain
MGNCQAAEAATVIIQHQGGKVERLYWPTTAADVMKTNPGHYVALVILCVSDKEKRQEAGADRGGPKVTRVKLLKPKDMLLLGQVYRLITSQGLLCYTCIVCNFCRINHLWCKEFWENFVK